MLAMLEYHLAIDNDVVDPFGPLHPPWGAGRTIVPDLIIGHAELGEIEQHEVRTKNDHLFLP
jgi:hypothetical protein